jgi:hypothetical protein
MTEIRGNFDDPERKRHALDVVRALTGNQRVTIVYDRKRQNDRMQKFYWPNVVQPIADRLRGAGRQVTDEQVHHMLMLKFLREEVAHPETGEVIGVVIPSSNDVPPERFDDFVAKVAEWARKTFTNKSAAAFVAA